MSKFKIGDKIFNRKIDRFAYVIDRFAEIGFRISGEAAAYFEDGKQNRVPNSYNDKYCIDNWEKILEANDILKGML